MLLQHVVYMLLAEILFLQPPFLTTQAHADGKPSQQQLAGRIVSAECPSAKAFQLERNGHPVNQESNLYKGDTIRIDPNCKVTISIGSSVRVLSSKESPYEVVLPATPGIYDRVLFAMGLSEGLPGNAGGAGITQGISQGISRADGDAAELTIPLLDLWNSHIAAGTRALFLAWRDGKGPFEITIAANGKETIPLAKAKNIQIRAVHFDTLNLKPGTYTVTIRDLEGHSAQANFMAVDPSKIPAQPAELKTSSSANDLLQAGWLASRGYGEYVFEAYQRISVLGHSDKNVNRIREALEMGWRPELN